MGYSQRCAAVEGGPPRSLTVGAPTGELRIILTQGDLQMLVDALCHPAPQGLCKRGAKFLLAWTVAATASMGAADYPGSFTADIRRVFENSCWKCLGSSIQLSKLDLRSRDA